MPAMTNTTATDKADWFFDIISQPVNDAQYNHAWLYLIGPDVDAFDPAKATAEVAALASPPPPRHHLPLAA